MRKYEHEAQEILELIGGKENLITASHCVTRLRLILKDESLANTEKLSENPIVKGCFSNSGQFQIIIGNEVGDVYKEFITAAGISESSKEQIKVAAREKMGKLQKVVGVFSEIFTPLLQLFSPEV